MGFSALAQSVFIGLFSIMNGQLFSKVSQIAPFAMTLAANMILGLFTGLLGYLDKLDI